MNSFLLIAMLAVPEPLRDHADLKSSRLASILFLLPRGFGCVPCAVTGKR